MWPKWPIILLLFLVATPLGILGESLGDTTPSDEAVFDGSTSPSTTPSTKLEETTDRLINGDLRKAARIEPMSGGSEQKRGEDEHYDVIDVMAATGAGTGTGAAGRPKSGQTTRIYTTGEVDESFWLKHLGDDFKHAIHLQVGGTNEEYNRLVNQTQNGVHEEVHHEYLPGAERPDGGVAPSATPPSRMASGGYFRGSQQQSFDSRTLAMKQQYLIRQQAQYQQQKQHQQYNYALQHRQLYTPQTQSQQHQYRHQHPQQHQHQHSQQHPQQQHQYPETQQPQQPPIRYQKPQKHGYIINSSEDQLHASQSNSAPVQSGPEGGGAVGYEEEGDSFNSQLNFKSPFNDYGSRPTRDLAYLLYRRGL